MRPADAPGAASRPVRVLGIGNPDRGDDGVGEAVVRALERRRLAAVELRARRGDMLALLDDFESGEATICIDAAAGDVAGRVHRIDIATGALPRDVAFVSSHAFGLPEVVALARVLGLLPKEVVIYAVEGTRFDPGASLGEAVASVVEDVADRVAAEVGRLRRRGGRALEQSLPQVTTRSSARPRRG